MKKRTKIIISGLVLTLAFGAGVVTVSANGFWKTEEYTEKYEKKTAMINALANNDYQLWVAAVGENCPMLEKINKDNFAQLVEAFNLMKEGKENFKEAWQIKEDLGLIRMKRMRMKEGFKQSFKNAE